MLDNVAASALTVVRPVLQHHAWASIPPKTAISCPIDWTCSGTYLSQSCISRGEIVARNCPRINLSRTCKGKEGREAVCFNQRHWGPLITVFRKTNTELVNRCVSCTEVIRLDTYDIPLRPNIIIPSIVFECRVRVLHSSSLGLTRHQAATHNYTVRK